MSSPKDGIEVGALLEDVVGVRVLVEDGVGVINVRKTSIDAKLRFTRLQRVFFKVSNKERAKEAKGAKGAESRPIHQVMLRYVTSLQ